MSRLDHLSTVAGPHKAALITLLAVAAAGCASAVAAEGPASAEGSAVEAAAPTGVKPPAAYAPALDTHNELRAKHCAPPLAWSEDLSKAAQKWADTLAKRGCKLEHNKTEHGENLAGGTPGAVGPSEVVRLWYAEVANYDFKKPKFAMNTGHFTQLVWAGTKRVGCGTAKCKDKEVWVCNYDPAGNIEGQFPANVMPTSCKR